MDSQLSETGILERHFALNFAMATDVGCKRKENQDAFGFVQTKNISMFVVADGMGGAKGGAQASAVALNIICRACFESIEVISKESLVRSIELANSVIFNKSQIEAELSGMGTTVVALAVVGKDIIIAHVGDSRIYRQRDGNLVQLTRDHTLVQDLVDTGALTEEQAIDHPVSHMLTRSLGPTDSVQVDIECLSESVIPSDRFLLCCDGLYNHVKDDEIAQIMEHFEPDAASLALISLAKKRGGSDNITVQVIDIKEVDSSVSLAPPDDGQFQLLTSSTVTDMRIPKGFLSSLQEVDSSKFKSQILLTENDNSEEIQLYVNGLNGVPIADIGNEVKEDFSREQVVDLDIDEEYEQDLEQGIQNGELQPDIENDTTANDSTFEELESSDVNISEENAFRKVATASFSIDKSKLAKVAVFVIALCSAPLILTFTKGSGLAQKTNKNTAKHTPSKTTAALGKNEVPAVTVLSSVSKGSSNQHAMKTSDKQSSNKDQLVSPVEPVVVPISESMVKAIIANPISKNAGDAINSVKTVVKVDKAKVEGGKTEKNSLADSGWPVAQIIPDTADDKYKGSQRQVQKASGSDSYADNSSAPTEAINWDKEKETYKRSVKNASGVKAIAKKEVLMTAEEFVKVLNQKIALRRKIDKVKAKLSLLQPGAKKEVQYTKRQIIEDLALVRAALKSSQNKLQKLSEDKKFWEAQDKILRISSRTTVSKELLAASAKIQKIDKSYKKELGQYNRAMKRWKQKPSDSALSAKVAKFSRSLKVKRSELERQIRNTITANLLKVEDSLFEERMLNKDLKEKEEIVLNRLALQKTTVKSSKSSQSKKIAKLSESKKKLQHNLAELSLKLSDEKELELRKHLGY